METQNPKKITVLGGLTLKNLDIPDELRSQDSLSMEDNGIVLIVLPSGKEVAVERTGLNIGFLESEWEEIQDNLAYQTTFEFDEPQTIPIISGDGKHKSCYATSDGLIVARFIKSIDFLEKRLYKAFSNTIIPENSK